MEFPKTLAAIEASDKCQWKIGDALLAEIPWGGTGKNNKETIKLQKCEKELRDHGHDYATTTLKKYRETSHNFKGAGARVPGVSYSVHQEAGSPEMLDAVLKVTKGKPASGDRKSPRSVRTVKKLIHTTIARRNREESGEPRKQLPKKDKAAVALTDRELGGLRLLAEVTRHVSRLTDSSSNIEDATEFVKEYLAKLDSEDTEMFTELAFEIAKKGHKLGEAAQRLVDRKRKHLAAV
jgi:hypothetical protein